MQSSSTVIMCAAGGGKTTRIVEQALSEHESKSAILTFTRQNLAEIERKIYTLTPAIPKHIEINTWLSFLLKELVRPYRPVLHSKRVDGLSWVNGTSARFARERDVERHYFAEGRLIYTDKIAKFACACDEKSGGAVLRRLSERFDHIFIDEVQDMAGYDLDILERILRAGIRLTMIGDHRQATYVTHNSKRNSGCARSAIAKKFSEWSKKGLVSTRFEQNTYRCHPLIAALADSLYPGDKATISLNKRETEHDGVFTVPSSSIREYVHRFQPQILRLDRRTDVDGRSAMNFGESKGLTFERVLIFPHVGGRKWIKEAKLSHIEGSLAKMYVAITRARQSVAFVYDGTTLLPDIVLYQES